MTVRELLARCDSAELTEWIAYERITGVLGAERADILHGILAATVSNTARGKGRKATPRDFIPHWDQNREPDWQQMLATARALTSRLGGTDTSMEGVGDDTAE
ncbi:phage tail assembly protein T [Streptomyces tsukubensis]